MPARLFSLRNVPDDEANDIRTLLTDNDIDFYETSTGNWNISSPDIWLRQKEQLPQAKALIDSYQQQRGQQQRELYEQLKRDGKHKTFLALLSDDPLKVIAYIAIVGVILYFSIKPFISLGN